MRAERPTIVCLCGSTRFYRAFAEAQLEETLRGNIVLTVGSTTCSDSDLIACAWTDSARRRMERRLGVAKELHFHKIDMADEILVLNVGGYYGESTRSEIAYAEKLGKRIRYLE